MYYNFIFYLRAWLNVVISIVYVHFMLIRGKQGFNEAGSGKCYLQSLIIIVNYKDKTILNLCIFAAFRVIQKYLYYK